MSRRTRRSVDIFNLSFLDVVSCGFGAIILLLVIVKVSEPHVIEQLAVDLSGLVAQLEAELHEIRGDCPSSAKNWHVSRATGQPFAASMPAPATSMMHRPLSRSSWPLRNRT
jgi:hypothetical protein